MKFLKNNKKNIIVVAIILLLVFVLTIGFHFFKEEDVIPDNSKNPVVLPDENELEFTNQSSFTVDDLWNLVDEKKNRLRALFYESHVYEPYEVDSTKYTLADNEKYVVFDKLFLEELHQLVTDEIYFKFFNQMTLLKDQYYVVEQDIFDVIYLNSAISEIDVLTSETRLIHATDDYINASVHIQICEEEENCSEDFTVPFELNKIDNEWKVASFYLQ